MGSNGSYLANLAIDLLVGYLNSVFLLRLVVLLKLQSPVDPAIYLSPENRLIDVFFRH